MAKQFRIVSVVSCYSSVSPIRSYHQPTMADPNVALQKLHHTNLQNVRHPQVQCYCSRLDLLATGTKADLIARIQPLLAPASSTPTTSSPGSSSITITVNMSALIISSATSLVSLSHYLLICPILAHHQLGLEQPPGLNLMPNKRHNQLFNRLSPSSPLCHLYLWQWCRPFHTLRQWLPQTPAVTMLTPSTTPAP